MGKISHSCLGKLIGRLSSSQTCIFGKFARTRLRPTYREFYRRVYNAQMSVRERGTPEWRRHVIGEFTPSYRGNPLTFCRLGHLYGCSLAPAYHLRLLFDGRDAL